MATHSDDYPNVRLVFDGPSNGLHVLIIDEPDQEGFWDVAQCGTTPTGEWTEVAEPLPLDWLCISCMEAFCRRPHKSWPPRER